MQQTLQVVWDISLTLLLVMIPIFLPPLLKKLLDKLGADADASNRAALITAVTNGLISALAALGRKPGDTLSVSDKIKVLASATRYVEQTVPGKLKKLGVDSDNVEKLAESHLPQVLGDFATTANNVVQSNPILVETLQKTLR